MPTWNAAQYLRFADERTRPCRDLAAALALEAPRRIIDLGCGPGNSTAVLAARWPDAETSGLDSSEAMILAARRDAPQRTWAVGDIGTWKAPEEAPFDLVFSNAALHWVPDHDALYPRLLAQVSPGGALATQVPNNMGAAAHEAMREIAARPAWRAHFPVPVREWRVHPASFYYDLLAPLAARIDIWETEYLHVLPGPEAIVEWYKGSGLRPFLDALPDEGDRQRFLDDYLQAVTAAYPARQAPLGGHVLLPFRRLFVIAYRASPHGG
jgi:trans-aconitate 2-methyltransferase